MKRHGLLFSPAMAHARYLGNKRQTRRPITQHNSIITGLPKNMKKQFRWEELAILGTRAGSVLYVPPPHGTFVHAQWPWPSPAVGISSNLYLTPRIQPGHTIWWKETWRVVGWHMDTPHLAINHPATPRSIKHITIPEAADPDGDIQLNLMVQCSDDAIKAGVRTDGDGNFISDDLGKHMRNRSGMLMYHWAARFEDPVVATRAERLLDITDADALAEGIRALSKDGGRTVKYGLPDRDGMPGNDDLGWPWHEWCNTPREAYLKLWEKINGPGSVQANPWLWVYEMDIAP